MSTQEAIDFVRSIYPIDNIHDSGTIPAVNEGAVETLVSIDDKQLCIRSTGTRLVPVQDTGPFYRARDFDEQETLKYSEVESVTIKEDDRDPECGIVSVERAGFAATSYRRYFTINFDYYVHHAKVGNPPITMNDPLTARKLALKTASAFLTLCPNANRAAR